MADAGLGLAGPGSLIVSSILGDSGSLGSSPASAQQSIWPRLGNETLDYFRFAIGP
jgi:hypothetical protein